VVCARFVAEDVAGAPAGETAPPTQAAFGEHRPAPSAIGEMRDLMDRHVGVVRDGAGLSEAISRLETLRADGADTEAEGPLSVALAIARAALARTESRGAHFRSDAGPPEEPPRHSQTEWKGPLTRFEV
jgi:L-aspartate oxidase